MRQKRSAHLVAALVAAALMVGLVPASAGAGPNGIVYTEDSAYELVDDPDLATRGYWRAAFRAFRRTAPGCQWSHLATITSSAEQDIVADLMVDSDRNAWLGGFQPRRASVPTERWRWITGVRWDYEAWADGEPNDQNLDGFFEPGFEQYLEALEGDGSWNDVPNGDPVGPPKFFIVESENCR
jgi:hypothetical protein